MSIFNTKSSFFYDFDISSDEIYIDFNEGGGELTATLDVGSYTAEGLATEIKTQMDSAGGLVYTVDFNRSTRKYTISSTSNFSILCNTGSNVSQGAYSVLGLGAADLSGASTYTAGSVAGSIYQPQYELQNYIGPDDNQRAVDETVNVSASGKVEVVTFGTQKFIEFNMMYITDVEQPSGGPIESNTSGHANARTFMQYLKQKKEFEFMPDRDTPDTYYTVILERTPESGNGTAYKLKPMYGAGLPSYYETGMMTLRVIE